MFEGKPRELFARFAIPQMIGLLFNSVYTIVDGVFIGNRLGREAMAAAWEAGRETRPGGCSTPPPG